METLGHSRRFPSRHWAMFIATISGLLFPLVSITIIILSEKAYFSVKNIISIHVDHPEIFMLYLLPIISAYIIHFFYNRLQKNQGYYQEMINRKNETIDRNALIVSELDKGNYSIQIIPEGEEDVLGKSLLVLKENLQASYTKESLQHWIYEGKNLISHVLRLYNKLEDLGDPFLEHLINYIDAVQGAIYLFNEEENSLVSLSTYAYHQKKSIDQQFKLGFGLIGQSAYDKEYIYRTEIPEDYFTISSGLLGEQKPMSLLIVPLITDDMLQGVLEIASLSPEIPKPTIELVNELGDILSRTIFNLRENQKNEKRLLKSRLQDVDKTQKKPHRLVENASDIEDSIDYAERIQSNIIPNIRQVQEIFPKCFIYYKPRNMLSGDLPWIFPDGDLVYLAAVDCKGHGMAGALLSFVAYFLLNNIVDQKPGFTAGQICDMLHAGIRKTLQKESENIYTGGGIDLAFCRIDLKSFEIHYSGAHRPLYLLRNGELTEFKGDRTAIGDIPNRNKPESPFTNHIVHYDTGDKIFFFTDGMPDQLGGPEKKKYSTDRIKNIIIENQGFTMDRYKQYFERDFENWMQDVRQIDDVLLIGIEF
jgi:serine phosphatase RsbU (regulator of sigma subunit)